MPPCRPCIRTGRTCVSATEQGTPSVLDRSGDQDSPLEAHAVNLTCRMMCPWEHMEMLDLTLQLHSISVHVRLSSHGTAVSQHSHSHLKGTLQTLQSRSIFKPHAGTSQG